MDPLEQQQAYNDTLIKQGELEVVNQAIPFKIFTGLLRAYRDPDGKMRLKGVASSTIKDRHGDTMEKSALEDMVRAANDNMTIFLNHSYDVPEDVAGSVETAQMFQRGMDAANGEIWDLDYDVLINEVNPRAVDAFQAIEKGTKLGLSIGAMIPEGGALRNKKTGAYRFQHVDLLETSIVGIPANPRSWVQNAVKALKSQTTMPLGSPTLTLDGDHYKIEGSLDTTQISVSSTKQLDTENPPDEAHQDDPAEPAAELGPRLDAPEVEPTDNAPETTPGPDEPEVQDAKIQVITIDTDDPQGPAADSQAAPDSEPDTESDDDVYDSTDANDVLAATLTGSLATLETTAAALVEMAHQRDEAFEERDAARRERDEVAAAASQVITQTSQIIEKLASMPVGRKAVIREARDDLQGLERIYGPEILKLIRSKNNDG